MSDPLLAIMCVLALGAFAQWAASRLRIPAILLLLAVGLFAGPGLEALFPGQNIALNPSLLIGDSFVNAFAALAVGLILYEGGLTLRFRELRIGKREIRNLVTIGAFVTWVLAALAARWVLGLSWGLSLVFGAILTVSGPTVVLPLVQHVRPRGAVGPILRWEGIVIDPIGALLAVLVFEVVKSGGGQAAAFDVLHGLLSTAVIGGGLGLLAGWLVAFGIRGYYIPDSLHNQVSIAIAVVAFTVSDLVQKESGLLATTVMGIYLANQRSANVEHILEFKENLAVLLISVLFVVLAARLDAETIGQIGPASAVFVGLLVLVVRPLSVAASTVGSRLNWRERTFLACVAPRGIVAAAITPVLAFDLLAANPEQYPDAGRLVPLMFAVIVGTVVVYGFLAAPAAKLLGVAGANAQGVMILGGQPWARAIGVKLKELGVHALVVDSNYQNTASAWMEGVPAHHGNVLSDRAVDSLELAGIGRVVALTPNDQVNTLACTRFSRLFGRVGVFQLTPKSNTDETNGEPIQLGGRSLGVEPLTYARLAALWSNGGGIVTTKLSSAYTIDAFQADHGPDAVPLFVLTESGKLTVLAEGQQPPPPARTTLISLAASASFVEATEAARQMLQVQEQLPEASEA
ncbi:MAG: sodium:proton antiporter [Planctomycetota bacterium]